MSHVALGARAPNKPEAARAGGTHAALAEVVQRVLRQEAALYRIASLGYQPFPLRLREIARLDATTLDVARVSFWSLKSGSGLQSIHCEELYSPPRGQTRVGRGADLA